MNAFTLNLLITKCSNCYINLSFMSPAISFVTFFNNFFPSNFVLFVLTSEGDIYRLVLADLSTFPYTCALGKGSSFSFIVGNVVKIRSNQEEIDSNTDTGGERIESSVEIEGDRTG